MIEHTYYRKERYYAKQFTGSLENAKEVIGWLNRHGLAARYLPAESIPQESGGVFQMHEVICISTGVNPAFVGEWIVVDSYGRAFKLSDEQFKKDFYKVPEGGEE